MIYFATFDFIIMKALRKIVMLKYYLEAIIINLFFIRIFYFLFNSYYFKCKDKVISNMQWKKDDVLLSLNYRIIIEYIIK